MLVHQQQRSSVLKLLADQCLQAVDLTGDREFLTGETAEQALAAMLAPESTVAKVSNAASTTCPCQC